MRLKLYEKKKTGSISEQIRGRVIVPHTKYPCNLSFYLPGYPEFFITGRRNADKIMKDSVEIVYVIVAYSTCYIYDSQVSA